MHAFIGACENMPSGTAYRPGDILISRLGKTVEITNTDAEGRLVLGDILTWAVEHKPAAIIDLATLTGACMVALGNYIVGAFGDDDATVEQRARGRRRRRARSCGACPSRELQKDALRSEVADMKNSGERWGGAINAALFLKEFVGDTPWVHLDIAGPSHEPQGARLPQQGRHRRRRAHAGRATCASGPRASRAPARGRPATAPQPAKAAKAQGQAGPRLV